MHMIFIGFPKLKTTFLWSGTMQTSQIDIEDDFKMDCDAYRVFLFSLYYFFFYLPSAAACNSPYFSTSIASLCTNKPFAPHVFSVFLTAQKVPPCATFL